MSGRTSPRIIRMLPGNVLLREPWPSELKFFRSRPEVAGMAAEDNTVILSPFAGRSEAEQEIVALNEAARVIMRRKSFQPQFSLTSEQRTAFASYGPPEAVKATVAARILSGDPSALTPTAEQLAFVERLACEMGISTHFDASRIPSPSYPEAARSRPLDYRHRRGGGIGKLIRTPERS